MDNVFAVEVFETYTHRVIFRSGLALITYVSLRESLPTLGQLQSKIKDLIEYNSVLFVIETVQVCHVCKLCKSN
jgi:hypothetical protein